MEETKKIAITGGTGHIGSVIAQKLGKDRCVIFCRPTSTLPKELEGFETTVVELTNKNEVLEACKGRGGIIHLACSLDLAQTLEFRKEVEIYGALKNLLDAAVAHSIPLVYASSIAARWSSPEPVINHLPTSNTNFFGNYALGSYSRSKQLGEELIQAKSAAHPSLRACSVLPSGVYGRSPMVGFWNTFICQVLESGKGSPAFGALQNPLVFVGDVGDVFLKALEKGERGGAYPCYGGNVGRSHVNDWLSDLAKALGVDHEEITPEDYDDAEKWPAYSKEWKFDNSVTESVLGVKFKTLEEVFPDLKEYLEERGVWKGQKKE